MSNGIHHKYRCANHDFVVTASAAYMHGPFCIYCAKQMMHELPDKEQNTISELAKAAAAPTTRLKTSEQLREEVLSAARQAVMCDRNKSYGNPEDNFEDIAQLWSAYLKVPVSPADVAAAMILMKVARIRTNPAHTDSWIDAAGYAACGNSAKNGPKIAAFARTLGTAQQELARQNSGGSATPSQSSSDKASS